MKPNPTTRILFMGTPDFAVPSLRLLHEQGTQAGWQIVGVATQPDRPAGRGNQVTATPVKQYAVAHNLPVLQPATLGGSLTQGCTSGRAHLLPQQSTPHAL